MLRTRVQKERTLSVRVPKGVEDGTRMRLAGEGEAGLRGGVIGIDRCAVHIALGQAHNVATLQVNRGKNDHGFHSKKRFRKLMP